MAQLTIVVGMAASGKTTYCRRLSRQTGAALFQDATLTRTDRRRAGFECLGELVARLVGRKEDCVIDESHLTTPAFRDLFRQFCDEFLPEIDQKWVFFEKDVLACINNLRHDQQQGRDDLARFIALYHQRRDYSVPSPQEFPGFELLPVWQGASYFTVESKGVAWLDAQVRAKRLQAW